MKDLTREHELKTLFLFSLPILVGNLLAVRTWNLRKKLWIRDLLSAFASV